MQVVSSLASPRAAVTAASSAVRVYELPDAKASVLAGDDRHRQFPLSAIASLHNLADAQTTMLDRYIRVVPIG
jgi:hypothetical protein